MKHNIINNPYVSVEVNEASLDPIYKTISQLLNEFGIPFKQCPRSHISLAYIIGDRDTEFLDDLLGEITEDKFAVRAIGLTYLVGKFTNKDYIALELESNTDFGYTSDFIAENCEVKQFDQKFVAHISLFEIDKNLVSDPEALCRVLETFGSDSIAGKLLEGTTVSVFNQNKEVETLAHFKR